MKRDLKRIALFTLLSGAPGLAFAAFHEVLPGDTLTQIAETNYGNWVKWKDLWKLNEDHVSNPDLIYPGQRLKLFTEDELAKLAENNPEAAAALSGNDVLPGRESISANDATGDVTPAPRRGHHSNEWSLLPLQNWENFVFRVDKQVDPDGFDRRSKIGVKVADKANADITISSDRIPILGEIVNARSEYERLFLGDQVFVRADEPLQVGTVYSVTSGPQKLTSARDGRVGFGYDLTGKIRIIGVRDGLFIGTIVAVYYPIRRHHLLIPEVPAYSFPDAVAASTPLMASMVVPSGVNQEMLGQEKIVFLDVGTGDGVKPGMIFRHYLHADPYNKQDISAKDFLIEAELKVLFVQDKFSVAIITGSRGDIHFGDELIALTDLSDYQKNQGIQTILQDTTKPVSVDDLDQLDNSDGLGEKENHDLRQLEKWAKPAPESSAPGATDPNDEILKVDTHEHPKDIYEIGKEPAPNDGTSSKPQTAPSETAPPPSTEAPPATTPETGTAPTQSTPPVEAAPPTSPSSSAPPPTLDSPAQESPPPASTTPAPAEGVTQPPADPFATPSP